MTSWVRHRAHLLLLLLLVAAAGVKAQDPVQQPPDPELKPSPLETLRNFEPAADEEYRLGKGDEISVEFAGRPEMLAKLVVGPDGRVTLPLAGDMLMAGLTRPEAAKAITTALDPYYTNLSCQVTVTRYTSNRVMLLGAVERPGVLTFDGTPTLLEALTRGGLVTGPNRVGKIPERCAIYRGQNQVVWVQLKQLIESGNTLADLRLRRDDVIYVPNASEQFVSVLGEVQHPGPVQLTSSSTLAYVLSMAGGTSTRAGNKPHIQIVDPATGTSRIVSMNDVLNPFKSNEIVLKPGQIVFVPQSALYRSTYVLERLSPLLSIATMAAVSGNL
ncbi:MAG: polysaccharide biosynthesis/export family protein [Terracidiphilus sp.]